jgi:hypothetical protein
MELGKDAHKKTFVQLFLKIVCIAHPGTPLRKSFFCPNFSDGGRSPEAFPVFSNLIPQLNFCGGTQANKTC